MPEEIKEKASNLILSYPDDLDENFINECLHFRAHCKGLDSLEDKCKSSISLLRWLRADDMNSIYPGIDIALQICVYTPVSNCTGERSFSVLKRIENYLRTSSSQGRLTSLALLSIESHIMFSLTFQDKIERFSASKMRRKML